MLSHDYGMLKGVEQAFHDFMADKPEPTALLPTELDCNQFLMPVTEM